jgi:hypothetical protein
MKEKLKNWRTKIVLDKFWQFVENRPSQTVIGLFIIIVILTISLAQLSPNYNWVICQHEHCWRAQNYKASPDGLTFYYNDKKYKIVGDYSIKEK